MTNQWNSFGYKPLFYKQFKELKQEVIVLKQKLPAEQFKVHPSAKRLAALVRFLDETIPNDPYASRFALRDALSQYKRAKGMGLSSRYRLFFRVMEANGNKAIFYIWLGYPRKEGDRKDCYEQFRKFILRADFPTSFQDLLEHSQGI
jgi:toxin YhaV